MKTIAGIAFTAALFWLAMAIAVGLANALAHADPTSDQVEVCTGLAGLNGDPGVQVNTM